MYHKIMYVGGIKQIGKGNPTCGSNGGRREMIFTETLLIGTYTEKYFDELQKTTYIRDLSSTS